MDSSHAFGRTQTERAIRDEYYKRGPKYYVRYQSLHNTPTAAHPAIYIPDASGRNPEEKWPMLRYEVESLDCRFADDEPTLMEDELYLIVVLPEFSAKATISVKETFDSDCSWQFGWITAVSDLRTALLCHRTPGDDAAPAAAATEQLVGRWELPYIHIACSTGEHAPWYSRAACSEPLGGGAGGQRTAVVEMHCEKDRVMPRVPWRVLLPGGYVAAHKYCVDVEYTSWLVLRNAKTEAMHVVRTVVWDRRVKVNIDVTKPTSSRCKLAEPPRDRVTSDGKNVPLPEWALGPPYANEELTFKAYTVPFAANAAAAEGKGEGSDADGGGGAAAATAAVVVEGPNNHYLNLPKM